MRSLRTETRSNPRSPQPEKARTQQRRPNAAKNKINKFIYIKQTNKKYIYKSMWSKDGSPIDEELKEEDKRSNSYLLS